MKFYSAIYTSMALATTMFLAGCTNEDEPIVAENSDVTFEITDAGFGSGSRASESGYVTEFTAGDACGLYIVRNGRIISDNIRIQASAGNGAQINWTPDSPIYGGLEGESVFLYYPYQSDMAGKINLTADDAEEFFAPLAASWEVKTNQSDYADYTASDLMTSKGKATATTDGKLNLSFIMTHRMALAVIPAPLVVYTFKEISGVCYGPMPDFKAELPIEFVGNTVPYHFEETSDSEDRTAYRYLYRPDQSTTISGSFETFTENPQIGGKETRAFSMTTSGKQGGAYVTYNVDPDRGPIECNLRPYDFFCKDKNNDWYVRPRQEGPGEECIGIVFYAGFNTSTYNNVYSPYPPNADMREDYDTPLYDDGPSLPKGVFHGYVVALADVTDITQKYRKEYGSCMLNDIAWSTSLSTISHKNLLTIGNKYLYRGYYNNLQIQKCIKETEGVTKYDFPAATACEYFGKRDFEWMNYSGRENTIRQSNAFGWQTRYSAPNNTTGWFIPSIAQLFKALQSLEISTKEIKALDGVEIQYGIYYWTSVESRKTDLDPSAGDAHCLPSGFSLYGSDTPPANSKSYHPNHTVRPILVF